MSLDDRRQDVLAVIRRLIQPGESEAEKRSNVRPQDDLPLHHGQDTVQEHGWGTRLPPYGRSADDDTKCHRENNGTHLSGFISLSHTQHSRTGAKDHRHKLVPNCCLAPHHQGPILVAASSAQGNRQEIRDPLGNRHGLERLADTQVKRGQALPLPGKRTPVELESKIDTDRANR